MKHHHRIPRAALLFIALAFGLATTIACEETPGQITMSVSGAQAGTEQNYYVVEIPEQGQTTVTITGSGQTPCPTEAEKCTCQHNTDKLEREKDESVPLKFTFNPKEEGTQDPNNGPKVTWNVSSSTSPGEYKFKVTEIEQKYKDCPQGWTGGALTKKNTQASEEVTILAYKIETETVATKPTDRKRRKLGIGEEVIITFKPADATVDWIVDNNNDGGSVNPSTGTLVSYTTASIPAQAKVYVVFKGIQKEIYFTNIAPSTAFLNLHEPDNTATSQTLRVKALLNVYIGPEDVNFSNVSIAEGTCNGSASGYFASADGREHIPSATLTVSECFAPDGNGKMSENG